MSIRITFDNPSATYFPGQTVSGTAIVHVEEQKKIRTIYVEFEGEEHCSFNRTRSVRKNGKYETQNVIFTGTMALFKHQQMLLSGSEDIKLPAGNHTYRFEYTLPYHLTGSVEEKYGHIRYKVKGCVDIPWKFDYTCTALFKVVSVVDLNTIPLARERFIIYNEKTVGCLCCSSGNISFTVSAPKRGFVCNEQIPFFVEIENNSGSEIYETVIRIVKTVEYQAHIPAPEKKTSDSDVVIERWSTNLAPYSGIHTFDAFLTLQPTEASTFNNTSIININYHANVKCKIRGMHINLEGTVPIFIGSIQIHVPDERVSNMAMPLPQVVPTPQVNELAEDKPPSYQSVMGNIGWNVN